MRVMGRCSSSTARYLLLMGQKLLLMLLLLVLKLLLLNLELLLLMMKMELLLLLLLNQIMLRTIAMLANATERGHNGIIVSVRTH